MERSCRTISLLFVAQYPIHFETLLEEAHEQGFVILGGCGGLVSSAESRSRLVLEKVCDSRSARRRDRNFDHRALYIAYIAPM
jgi:hypothetical protein